MVKRSLIKKRRASKRKRGKRKRRAFQTLFIVKVCKQRKLENDLK
jgi:hypothetical protein